MTDRQSTHAPGCWDWGPKHYECALREIEALRAEVERLNRILGRIVEGDGDSTTTIRAGLDAFAAAREYLLRQAVRAMKAAIDAAQPQTSTTLEEAASHARVCSGLAEQYKSDPVLFAALTDAAAIIRDLMCELGRETERRWEGNRRAAQEYVEDMRDVLREAAQVCKDLDDEALAKEGRLACGAECAAAIADLAVRMSVPFEKT